jgi:hypothetical protein
MRNPLILWILAVVVTLFSAIFQRVTGPSYPVRGTVIIDNRPVEFELLHSHDNSSDAIMEIPIGDLDITGQVQWRRFKSHDSLQVEPLKRQGNNLVVIIPRQPAAGKVAYQVSLTDRTMKTYDLTDKPVILRFHGPVPDYVLVLHIVVMFLAMLLATRTGLEALINGRLARPMAVWTSISMFVGGLILGPVVQKFAFGDFWTGWPLGNDLTDNKTVVAFFLWLVAVLRSRRGNRGRIWFVAASLLTLAIFLIPHSLLGSELDYTRME